MYSLYDIINELCKTKGITPGKMCRDIGISRGLITDLKMGRKHTANGSTLIKIANYLNVSVDFLLSGEKNNKDYSEIDSLVNLLINNPEVRIILKRISNIPASELKKIITMIDILEIDEVSKV